VTASGKAPYHHGDLRSALVQAATELAREGGPQAIVLREAARRVGVSQTAAYRHFSALPELVMAVAAVGLQGLANAMQAEIDLVVDPPGTPDAAIARMGATGRGYVHYALREPGLYATAFVSGHDHDESPAAPGTPYDLLQQGLAALIDVGLLRPEDRDHAAVTAWAAVHGLSMLLLGPLSGVPADQLDDFIDGCLRLVALGVLAREA
jgi:AcrR family transcriptional regulator